MAKLSPNPEGSSGKAGQKRLKVLVRVLMGVFVLLVAYFTYPLTSGAEKEALPFAFAAILILIFFVLGVLLLYYTKKAKPDRKTRIFLFFAGGSAASFLCLIVLHNLLYAGAVATESRPVICSTLGVLHAISFILAFTAVPVAFIVGATGSIAMLKRNKKGHNT